MMNICLAVMLVALGTLLMCVSAFTRAQRMDPLGDLLDRHAAWFTGIAILCGVTISVSFGSWLALWLVRS